MSRLIRVARGVLSDYLLWGVTVIAGILMTPLLLHHLRPEGYGLWAIFGSLLGYMALIDLGLGPATAKHVAQYRAQGRSQAVSEWVSSTLFLYALLSAAVVGTAIATAPWVSALFHVSSDLLVPARTAFVAIAAGLALALPRGALRGLIVGHQRMDIANVMDAIFVVIGAAAIIGVVLSGGGLIGAALASAAVSGLQTLVMAILARIMFPAVKVTPRALNPAVVRHAVRFSLPILIVFITAQVVFRTDNVIIGIFRGAREVADYAIAYSMVWFGLNGVFKVSDSLLPVFSGLEAGGERYSLRRAYLESCRLSLAVAFCLSVELIFFGKPALAVWVGPEHFVGMATLVVLAVLPAVHGATHVGSIMLISLGRARSIAVVSVPDALLNLGLSIVLVRRLGVVGVALGTLIPEALITAWYIPGLCNRAVGISDREFLSRVLLRPLVAAATGIPVAWGVTRLLMPSHPAGTVIAGGMLTAAVYFGTYLMVSPPSERAMYWRAFHKAFYEPTATLAEG